MSFRWSSFRLWASIKQGIRRIKERINHIITNDACRQVQVQMFAQILCSILLILILRFVCHCLDSFTVIQWTNPSSSPLSNSSAAVSSEKSVESLLSAHSLLSKLSAVKASLSISASIMASSAQTAPQTSLGFRRPHPEITRSQANSGQASWSQMKRPYPPQSSPTYDMACESMMKWMWSLSRRKWIWQRKTKSWRRSSPRAKELELQVVQRSLRSLQRKWPLPGALASRSSCPMSPSPPHGRMTSASRSPRPPGLVDSEEKTKELTAELDRPKPTVVLGLWRLSWTFSSTNLDGLRSRSSRPRSWGEVNLLEEWACSSRKEVAGVCLQRTFESILQLLPMLPESPFFARAAGRQEDRTRRASILLWGMFGAICSGQCCWWYLWLLTQLLSSPPPFNAPLRPICPLHVDTGVKIHCWFWPWVMCNVPGGLSVIAFSSASFLVLIVSGCGTVSPPTPASWWPVLPDVLGGSGGWLPPFGWLASSPFSRRDLAISFLSVCLCGPFSPFCGVSCVICACLVPVRHSVLCLTFLWLSL